MDLLELWFPVIQIFLPTMHFTYPNRQVLNTVFASAMEYREHTPGSPSESQRRYLYRQWPTPQLEELPGS